MEPIFQKTGSTHNLGATTGDDSLTEVALQPSGGHYNMKRQLIGCVSWLIVLITTGPICADVITETFDYPIQNDTVGFFDGSGTTYRITVTSDYGGGPDLTVATFGDGFQSGAGIVNEASNPVAFFMTSSQTGQGAGAQVFVGIADFPGFGDTPPGGPFGTFFEFPQDLSNATGSIDIRQAAGSNATHFRFVAVDDADNEVATNLFSLNGSFQNFEFASADFVNQVQGFGFFDDAVIGIGVEFFADADGSGNLDALEFRVDNFVLNTVSVPEPNMLAGVLLAVALGWTYVARQRRELT